MDSTSVPSAGEFLGHVSFDVPWLLAIGGVLYWYLRNVRRANNICPGKRHPAWRTASFIAGLGMLWVAAQSPIEYWGNILLWVNFLGFLVLTMAAAPLLVLGSPLTLAFKVGSPATRARLRGFYRRFPMSWLTFPVFTWLAFAVITYAWQFTALTEYAAHNPYVRDLQLVTLLFVAILFWIPALAADPVRWRLNQPLRFFYVMVEMVHKGLFGGMFLSLTSPVHKGLAADLPSWGPSAMTDQRMAILVLWIGGNLIFLIALAYIVGQWLEYEARNNHRTDRRLAQERRMTEERRRALEQVFQKPI